MPVVTVNIPEGKSDPLLKQLLSQFEALQQQVMSMQSADQWKPILTLMGKQQDALVRAMERMGKPAQKGHDSAMLEAVRGLKKVMASLPDDLAEALDGSYKKVVEKSSARPHVTVKPEVKVNLVGLGKTMSRIEDALVSQSKRGRNRTFGSNF